MQFTPFQIKEKLLKALDDQNNVVDANAALEVISILEQYPITREALEQTRIGKYINELRKKTANEQLAKRAKKLVKNWQKLVNTDPDSKQSINGERVVSPPQNPNVAALQSGGNGGVSPRLSQGDVARRRCLSPAMTGGKPLTPQLSRKTSPALVGGRPATPSLQASRLSPGARQLSASKPSTPTIRASTPLAKSSSPSMKPSTPSLQSARNSPVPGSSETPAGSVRRSGTPTLSLHFVSGARESPKLTYSQTGEHPSKHLSPQSSLNTSGSPKSLSPQRGRPSTPSSRAHTPSIGSCPLSPSNNDDSNLSWPDTPLSSGGNGEMEKNNSNSKYKGKSKVDSPLASSVHKETVAATKSNHSAVFSVTNSSDKGSRKDQSDTSKTNVANRKRTRTKSPDSVPKKQSKTDLSLSQKKKESTVNGVVGSHKHRKGDKVDPSKSNSATSLTYSKEAMSRDVSPVSPGDRTDVSHTSKKQVNSKAEMMPKPPKTPKVKTTAELIAELQKRTGSSNYGNDIMNKLKTNQIEKEEDAPCSVLPPGVKPRKKRGNIISDNLDILDAPSSVSLSQTKTEMVEKFLETSVVPSSSDQLSPYKDDSKCESPMNSTNSFGEAPSDSIETSVNFTPEKLAVHPSQIKVKSEDGVTVAAPKQLTVEEILRLLPPVETDNIDWEAYEYSLVEATTGSESEVTRLHAENWEYVNGCYDFEGVWHDWSQTLSRTSCDGDLLHILPYVNIDD